MNKCDHHHHQTDIASASSSSASSSSPSTYIPQSSRDDQQQSDVQQQQQEIQALQYISNIISEKQSFVLSSLHHDGSSSSSQQQQQQPGLTIVITGANSGIGFMAAKLLLLLSQQKPSSQHYRIVLACRTLQVAQHTQRQLRQFHTNAKKHHQSQLSQPTTTTTTKSYNNTENSNSSNHDECDNDDACNIIALECDHTSFASIRTFNDQLRRKLQQQSKKDHLCKYYYNGIDVLCCNAGILVASSSSVSQPQYTIPDQQEVTFQTNYLSPLLLIHSVMDLMNPQSGRIILTTSGLYQHVTIPNLHGLLRSTTATNVTNSQHEPEQTPTTKTTTSRTGMIDNSEFHYKKAYAVSKLCLVGLCAELTERYCNNYQYDATGRDDDDLTDHNRDNKHNTKTNITINCFSPGLMTTSGLFRHQPTKSQPQPSPPRNGGSQTTATQATNSKANSTNIQYNDIAPDGTTTTSTTTTDQRALSEQYDHLHRGHALLKEKTVAWGAGALVYMCLATATGQTSGQYWSDTHSTLGSQSQYGVHFVPFDIVNHLSSSIRKELWNISCQIVGVSSSSSLSAPSIEPRTSVSLSSSEHNSEKMDDDDKCSSDSHHVLVK